MKLLKWILLSLLFIQGLAYSQFRWLPSMPILVVVALIYLPALYYYYRNELNGILFGGLIVNFLIIFFLAVLGFLSPDFGVKKQYENDEIVLTSEIRGLSSCGANFVAYKKTSLGYIKSSVVSNKECFREIRSVKKINTLHYLITVENQRNETKTVEWNNGKVTSKRNVMSSF